MTRRPRAFNRFPSDEAVSPLPSDDATPPVTKRCLVSEEEEERAYPRKTRLPRPLRRRCHTSRRAVLPFAFGYFQQFLCVRSAGGRPFESTEHPD